MTAQFKIPAPDAPAEEWGRLAVSIPGLRWMPGMRDGRTGERYEDGDGPWLVNKWPDPDDPATEGCLLALLGPDVNVLRRKNRTVVTIITDNLDFGHYPQGRGHSLGRACIAAAAAIGEWPGGAR